MAKVFLTSIKDRPNLFFSKNTVAESIGISEPVDKRATGVNVSIDGVKLFVRAKKEVILAAGPINNAKLLLLSGIGDRKYLDRLKGELNLNETHLLGDPFIKGNFFADEDSWDFDTMLSGFNFVTNLTTVMEDIGAEFIDIDIPNCRNYKFCSTRSV
nr:unnamed protein product [Callosobruchus analis]